MDCELGHFFSYTKLGHFTYTSVSGWKFIIASAFKFTLLCQPEAAGQKLAAPGRYFYYLLSKLARAKQAVTNKMGSLMGSAPE